MAAALLSLRSLGRVAALSAGSSPAPELHPEVIAVMREVGADLTTAFPKALDDTDVRESDVVITMGCGDACPIYPGKRYEDWHVDDPAGQDTATVRRIRDEIDKRVRRLTKELLS
jgi:arsenate reductase